MKPNGTDSKKTSPHNRTSQILNAEMQDNPESLVENITEIEYIYFPFREKPARGILALVVLICFAYLSIYEIQSLGMAIILFLAGFFSLSGFYMPSRYRLNRDGVERVVLGITHRILWGQIKSFYVGDSGILLSPFSQRSLLEKFRGFELPLEYDKGLILSFIKKRIKKDAG